MSNTTYATSCALKHLGFPQPKPEAGQLWYKKIFEGGTAQHIAHCILLSFGGQIVMQAITPRWDYPGNSGFDKNAVFCPPLDYITQLLPEGFILEMWGGRHNCKIDTWQDLIQTQADSFAEAAALAWLALNTP